MKSSLSVLKKLSAALAAVFCVSCPGADALRVASLSPSVTEMVFQLGKGSSLVGRSSSCDYPAEAAGIQVVGGFGAPSLERLASLRPQLVITTSLKNQAMKEGIERLGAKCVVLPSATLEDYGASIRLLGSLLNCPEEAAKEAERFDKKLAEYRGKAERTPFAKRPKVYLEVWHKPLMSCGGGSFVNEMIEAAGGVNIGRIQRKDFFPCSEEWVLASDPDVIICPSMGSGAAGEVLARKGWGGVSAVKAGRVFTGLKESVIFRIGPRTLDGIELLRTCIEGAK
jgi:iron complex transport system substrate-binding protein